MSDVKKVCLHSSHRTRAEYGEKLLKYDGSAASQLAGDEAPSPGETARQDPRVLRPAIIL